MIDFKFCVFVIMLIALFSCHQIGSDGDVTIQFSKSDKKHTSSTKYNLSFFKGDKKIAEQVFQGGELVSTNGEIPDDVLFEYHMNGDLKNVFNYKNGMRNGKAFSLYKGGKLKGFAEYKDDEPIGTGKLFYENGNLMTEWEIVNGKEKYHKEYYESGQLKIEIYSKDGKLLKKEYDIDGSIIRYR